MPRYLRCMESTMYEVMRGVMAGKGRCLEGAFFDRSHGLEFMISNFYMHSLEIDTRQRNSVQQ